MGMYSTNYVRQPMVFAKSESVTSKSNPEPYVSQQIGQALKCILESWNSLPFASEQRSHCRLLNEVMYQTERAPKESSRRVVV